MAGETGDFALALEIVLVDGEHHGDHLASDDFGLLVVLLEGHRSLLADVAVLALDAQRGSDELHRRNYLLGGNAVQDFDVLELLFGKFGGGRHSCSGRLSACAKDRQGCGECNSGNREKM